jgi:gliding motility-associated-like protein
MVYTKHLFLSFKKGAIVFFLTLISLFNYSQNTFVPDDNFEQVLIDLGFDTPPLNDFVPTANINTIVNLDVPPNKNIVDLTGIEEFSALQKLDCRNNLISVLNVSQLPKLQILWCSFNQLTNLDVTQNSNLISLLCENNLLTNLDLTKNQALNILVCNNNQLTTLDISQNTTLSNVSCDFNFLTDLDTSKNTELNVLSCDDNLVASLNLTQNKKLRSLSCTRNQLKNLDISKNSNLVDLVFGDNQITSLDLSKNSKLESLRCGRNFLTKLDVSHNSLLTELSCTLNNLCSLNVKNGNNSNFTLFGATSNPDLSCIFVDNVAYSTNNWTNIDANSNFVSTQAECETFAPSPAVDSLNDFIGDMYVLPILNNGNYYTMPSGNGSQLNTGDTITTSQVIYIYNEIDCVSNESLFNVIINNDGYFIPKYFTPNNDGIHDFWEVIDNTNTIESITIYNRYGKLIKYLSANSLSWNGTFNGKTLNSDDYWYIIKFVTGEIIKGHFTLKR